MSFGFGFALPAYPLRGGGGNNPFNQLGPTLDLSFTGVVTDLTDPNGYTLNTDFIIPQYQIAAQYVVWETGVGLVDKTFSQIITFTRASTGTYFDSAGVLQSAAIDVPRLDYNPSTLAAQGFLVEEARTNSIRNNTMQGAAAGTPGTLPTNWSVSGLGTLTREIVGVGTSNGINYVDIRFSGTTSTTQVSVRLETSNGAAGTNGQTFTFSSWVARVAGSTSNIGDISANANIYDASSVFLTSLVFAGYPVTAPTTLSRASGTGTIASASAAFIQPQIYINFASGAAIDITLRIGLPQLEQGAFATSVIPTTTTALTRSADAASVNTLSPWYNSTSGTLFAEMQKLAVETASFPRVACFDDGGFNNSIQVLWNNSVSRFYGNVQVGGTTQADLGANGTTQTNVNKIAFGYQINNFAASVNGAAAITDVSGTIPSGISIFRLGRSSGGSDTISGYLRRITYYPRRLSNAELVSITTP